MRMMMMAARRRYRTTFSAIPRRRSYSTSAAFPHIKKPKVTPIDIQELERHGGRGGQPESDLVNRVVDAMVSKLTDHANIQALIDPSPKTSLQAEVNRAINDATTTLLEPIFLARSNKQ